MSEMNGERALEVLIRKTRRFVRRSPFSPTVQYKLLKLRHTNFFSGFGLLSGAIRFWRKLIVEEQNHGGKSVKLIADEDRYVLLLFQLKSEVEEILETALWHEGSQNWYRQKSVLNCSL